MKKIKTRNKILISLTILVVLIGFVFLVYPVIHRHNLKERTSRIYSQLSLPRSFQLVTTSSVGTKGDIITNPISAQARTYRSPFNMEETNKVIIDILLREQDKHAAPDSGGGDNRLSIHPEARDYPIDNAMNGCSPVETPLKSGGFVTVLFSSSEEDAKVKLNEDGKVVDIQKYNSHDCDTTTQASYVTIVTWAM